MFPLNQSIDLMVSHRFPYENGHFAIASPGQMEHKNHIKPPSNTGWWLTYPSEKYSSNGNIIPNIYGGKKGPNHQPE